MRDIIILGAGMVGVSAALHLQARGCSVVLVDRREPGREASYGNAGIIQAEAMEPYALPHDLPTLLAIAAGTSNAVHYTWRALPAYALPLLRYWWNSFPDRHRAASRHWSALIARAVSEHEPLIAAAGAGPLVRHAGFRILYRSERDFDAGAAEAEDFRRRYGLNVGILDAEGLKAAEPALKTGGAGGVHWHDPWTVNDPGALVTAYAELLRRRGGTPATGDAATLKQTSAGWSIVTDEGPFEAEAVVVALGSWSPNLAARFGYRFPMVRKRGYHRHYAQGRRGEPDLDLPLLDSENGYVMAPMARGLRLTTGAELAPLGAPPTPVQLQRAEQAAAELVELGAPVEDAPWFGWRPCMPDMLPVIGPAARHKGLWFDFGHGHQGHTLGPVTGRLLAEQLLGETPFTDPSPYAPSRYG